MPVTPDAPPLPGALAESERVAALLPGSRILLGPQATRASVTTALRDHPVAHFACHGLGDWANPAASALILHDHATAAALTAYQAVFQRAPGAVLGRMPPGGHGVHALNAVYPSRAVSPAYQPDSPGAS